MGAAYSSGRESVLNPAPALACKKTWHYENKNGKRIFGNDRSVAFHSRVGPQQEGIREKRVKTLLAGTRVETYECEARK